MENQANQKGLEVLKTGPKEASHLNRLDFVKAMVKLAAAYPYFSPTELTWEVYWEDLACIPAKDLLRGTQQCRLSCKFFPTVSEIIQASIGNHHRVVPWDPYHSATLQDIIRHYQVEYKKLLEEVPEALEANTTHSIEDRRKKAG